MTRAETQAVWTERIAAQQASGESAVGWCFRHDIRVQSFYTWRHRLTAGAVTRDDAPQWMAVGDAVTAPAPAPLLIEIGAVRLTLPSGVEPTWFAAVLRALTRC